MRLKSTPIKAATRPAVRSTGTSGSTRAAGKWDIAGKNRTSFVLDGVGNTGVQQFDEGCGIFFNPNHDLMRYELKAPRFSNVPDSRIQEMLTRSRPDLNEALGKRKGGYELMRQLYELVRSDDAIDHYLTEYFGHPGIFWRSVSWHVDFLGRIRDLNESGQFDLDPYLDIPVLAHVKKQWQALKAKGWKAKLYYDVDVKDETTPLAQARTDRKEITIPFTPTLNRPLPLVVAEEVLHAVQDELESLNAYYFIDYFTSRIQGHFKEKGVTGVTERVGTTARYLRSLVCEFDVRLQLMGCYRAYVRRRSEFRTSDWEGLATEGTDMLRNHLHLYMKQSSYATGAPSDVFELLRSHSYEDIIVLKHGIRTKDLPRIKPLLKPLPSVTWPAAERILDNTPEVFKKINWDGLKTPGDVDMADVAKSLGDDELQQIKEYMSDPFVLYQSHALERMFRGKFDEDDPELKRALEVPRNVAKGIFLLSYYDSTHGTRHARDFGMELIKEFQPPATAGHLCTVMMVASKILGDEDHDGLAPFMEAISASPVRSILYRIHEQEYEGVLCRLIQAASQVAADQRPSPGMLMELCEEYFDRVAATARIIEREYALEMQKHGREEVMGMLLNIPRAWARARDLAHELKGYFSKIGDKKRVQYLGDLYGTFKNRADLTATEIANRWEEQFVKMSKPALKRGKQRKRKRKGISRNRRRKK